MSGLGISHSLRISMRAGQVCASVRDADGVFFFFFLLLLGIYYIYIYIYVYMYNTHTHMLYYIILCYIILYFTSRSGREPRQATPMRAGAGSSGLSRAGAVAGPALHGDCTPGCAGRVSWSARKGTRSTLLEGSQLRLEWMRFWITTAEQLRSGSPCSYTV